MKLNELLRGSCYVSVLFLIACKPDRNYWSIANEEFNDKDYLGAIIELNSLVKKDPQNDSAFVLRASAFSKIGKDKKALKDLETAISINPANDKTKLELARVIASEQPQQALKLLLSVPLKKGRLAADVMIEKGRIHYFDDNFEASLSDFTAAINADSSYHLAWYYRGLMRSSFFDKDGSSGNQIFAFFDFDKALYDFSRAVALNPTFADGWFQRSMVYFNRFDGVNGLNDINQAIMLEPRYSYYYLGRAHYYATTGNNLIQALKDCNYAIALNDDDPNAFEERAAIFNKLGNAAEAEKDLLTAQKLKSVPRKK